ncbi:acyl-CoA dehydrogenase family protein [Streptomyces puniciscabiei]|uniref:acyl-CoA dehydrogenase family protein n=1 Tax=Streptomyces puniciscabiei TaxID=164348 RepID=UPI003317C712
MSTAPMLDVRMPEPVRRPDGRTADPAPGRLSYAEVIAAAADERGALDGRRRLSAAVAAALSRAGFARHFVPVERGGRAGGFAELLAAVAAVGETCASTAWCAALYAAHGRLAAYLPEAGQREVWADGPDVRIAASVVPPQGEARPEPGGWRLTGSWAYASGVDHAKWVLLASRTPGEGEAGHRVFAVPRTAVTVADTWRTLGLRGTGSNSVAVDGVHVPEHRTVTLADLGRVRPGAARCHRVPYAMVAALMFAAPALGTARGAVRDWEVRMAARTAADGRAARDSGAVQQVLARSTAHIESAQLLLEQAAHRADHAEATPLAVAANRRDAALAVELCTAETERLWRALGAGGLAEDDPVQRRWRDAAAVAAHPAVSFEAAAGAYAHAVFARGAGAGDRAEGR